MAPGYRRVWIEHIKGRRSVVEGKTFLGGAASAGLATPGARRGLWERLNKKTKKGENTEDRRSVNERHGAECFLPARKGETVTQGKEGMDDEDSNEQRNKNRWVRPYFVRVPRMGGSMVKQGAIRRGSDIWPTKDVFTLDRTREDDVHGAKPTRRKGTVEREDENSRGPQQLVERFSQEKK